MFAYVNVPLAVDDWLIRVCCIVDFSQSRFILPRLSELSLFVNFWACFFASRYKSFRRRVFSWQSVALVLTTDRRIYILRGSMV